MIPDCQFNKLLMILKTACKKNTPAYKGCNSLLHKPTKNKTGRKPDFYLHETDEWLVFPHELDGLTIDEIKENKPALEGLIDYISSKID